MRGQEQLEYWDHLICTRGMYSDTVIKAQHRDAVVAVYMRTLAQVMLHCTGMYGTYNVHVYRALCIHGTYYMHTLCARVKLSMCL